jgi:hypothetical protein
MACSSGKSSPVNAVRESFHHDRPPPEMRQHRRSDPLVVSDESSFGDPIVGEEHFLGVCDGNSPATDPKGFTLGAWAHSGRSRMTSRGCLSRRMPKKRGWRSRPSRVHCMKLTCATTFGLTQCTPFSDFSSSANGDCFVSNANNSLPRLTSRPVSKPVPTLPA